MAQTDGPQIGNSDFESWKNYGSKNHAPDNWNSFETAAGAFASLVKAQQVERSTDVRPGSTGKYSVKIYARNVLKDIAAQGNLTVGQIQAGATTPTDEKNNNKTVRASEKTSEKLGKLPVALKLWAKFIPGVSNPDYSAHISVMVHDDYDYITYPTPAADAKHPENSKHLVAKGEGDIVNTEWQQVTVPISTDGCIATSPDYILVNISTSGTPGKGTAADKVDELLIDDVELVYGDATGIDNVKAEMVANKVAYNLNGQRIANLSGCYVINGKKYIAR